MVNMKYYDQQNSALNASKSKNKIINWVMV